MKTMLQKIVLVMLLVLSLFVLLLHYYLSLPTRHAAPAKIAKPAVTIQPSAPETTVSQIKAVLHEKNSSLEKAYRSVASEIQDFRNAKQLKPESNKTAEKTTPKRFVSQCRRPQKPVAPHAKPAPEAKPESAQSPRPKADKVKPDHRPRLAIIMDDVSTPEQGRMIKALPIRITPSIFPVTEDHPYTRRIAKMFHCYMVHTPMEAYHYPNEEAHTLHVGDSLATVERRIAQIKRDFPRLTAINNHTGSRFTSDALSMDRLFCALQKYGIRFVDSRTSPRTQANRVAAAHGMRIWQRDVFLDNVDDVHAILDRLREAVRYARKHKVAIAICHPRPATFAALRASRKILHGVKVVTMEDLCR